MIFLHDFTPLSASMYEWILFFMATYSTGRKRQGKAIFNRWFFSFTIEWKEFCYFHEYEGFWKAIPVLIIAGCFLSQMSLILKVPDIDWLHQAEVIWLVWFLWEKKKKITFDLLCSNFLEFWGGTLVLVFIFLRFSLFILLTESSPVSDNCIVYLVICSFFIFYERHVS